MREQLSSQKLGSLSDVVKAAADTEAVLTLWRSHGVPNAPVVPFLEQFPAFAVRRLLAAARRLELERGTVLAEPDDDTDGVYVLLDGRVDLHSWIASAHRDAELVRFLAT